jgi:hypothetical protein
LLEELFPPVVLARPAPDVLALSTLFTSLQDTSADAPHDDAEDEEANRNDCIVNTDFLSPLVTTSPIAIKHHNRKEE